MTLANGHGAMVVTHPTALDQYSQSNELPWYCVNLVINNENWGKKFRSLGFFGLRVNRRLPRFSGMTQRALREFSENQAYRAVGERFAPCVI